MKRTLFALALAVASLAAEAVAVVENVGAKMVGFARAAIDLTIGALRSVFAGPVAMTPQATASRVTRLLSASDAATLRQAKRERPTISANWRMCPSG